MSDIDWSELGDSKRREMASEATIRDYFAAAALQGLCANEQCKAFSFSCDSVEAARLAYKMADAMLEQRNK